MSGVFSIEALGAVTATNIGAVRAEVAAAPRPAGATSFSQMLLGGVNSVNQQLTEADGLAAAFAVDDSIPLHRVTYALEHARLSFELMLQVRSRLVEGYQEIMRMQL
jgi:flagellar hook-basal body complex protein FliE